MNQISFSGAEYADKRKKARRDVLLEEAELVAPWRAPPLLTEPHYPGPSAGAGLGPQESMLRVHLLQTPHRRGRRPDGPRAHVMTTAVNEAAVEQVTALLDGKNQHVLADLGYQGTPALVDRDEL